MHKRDALTKRRVKHGFTLFHFHLDATGSNRTFLWTSLAVIISTLSVSLMDRNCRSAMRRMGAAEAAPTGCGAPWQGLILKPLR